MCLIENADLLQSGSNTSEIMVKQEKSPENRQTIMAENPFKELYFKNFHMPEGRTLYLSRHGESEYNVEDRIGGDPMLTERGQQYARALGYYFLTAGNILYHKSKGEPCQKNSVSCRLEQ